VREAVDPLADVVRLEPENVEARHNLGVALFQLGEARAAQGRWDEAIPQYERVVQLKPDNAQAHDSLGLALSRQGRYAEAVGHFQKALAINPKSVMALNNLAWVLATCGEASVRDGARAVELAAKANEVAGDKDAGVLDTLAAAYAEAGRFDDAVRTAQTAIELARGAGAPETAQRIQGRLESYRAGQPYHERLPTHLN
jgi:protein O-mannosyl-transferase